MLNEKQLNKRDAISLILGKLYGALENLEDAYNTAIDQGDSQLIYDMEDIEKIENDILDLQRRIKKNGRQ